MVMRSYHDLGQILQSHNNQIKELKEKLARTERERDRYKRYHALDEKRLEKIQDIIEGLDEDV